MALLFEGRIADLILFIIFNGVILFLIYQARGGKVFTLKKRLAGLDAIPEAVGRAVEMGRPVHFTPGGSGLTGGRGTHIQAGLVIGGHVASYCARLGAHLIMSLAAPAQIPLTEEIYRTAYTAEGQPDVNPDVRFYGRGDAPFGAGCLGTIANENCAVNMIIGGSGSDFPIISEGAHRVGAFQIGGSANTWMIPLVVAGCDYTIIGEELFAAGAMLSEESIQLASIVASDYNKIIILALILLGSILSTAGISTILDFLKL